MATPVLTSTTSLMRNSVLIVVGASRLQGVPTALLLPLNECFPGSDPQEKSCSLLIGGPRWQSGDQKIPAHGSPTSASLSELLGFSKEIRYILPSNSVWLVTSSMCLGTYSRGAA